MAVLPVAWVLLAHGGIIRDLLLGPAGIGGIIRDTLPGPAGLGADY